MRRHALASCALAVALAHWAFACATAGAQPPPVAPEVADFDVTCETYCSETQLRTASARISWTVGPAAVSAVGLGALASAAMHVDTTVFKDGFEKSLFASFPTLEPGRAPETPPEAGLDAGGPLRAFQIEIVEVERATPLPELGAGEEARNSMVVEDLEPGMNYTWRVVIEVGEGRVVSETVTCQAPVCPADFGEVEP